MKDYTGVWDTTYSDGTRTVARIGKMAIYNDKKPRDICLRVSGNVFRELWFDSEEEANAYVRGAKNEG